jgi:hypothetical protein
LKPIVTYEPIRVAIFLSRVVSIDTFGELSKANQVEGKIKWWNENKRRSEPKSVLLFNSSITWNI